MAKDAEGNDKSYLVTFKGEAASVPGAPEHPRQIRIACDYFTVEPSGAVTFWVRSPDGERSALIAAYGTDEWHSITLAS